MISNKIFLEIIPGLEQVSKKECKEKFGKSLHFHCSDKDGFYAKYTGKIFDLLKLKTVPSIYLLEQFLIERPNTLLSPEKIIQIVSLINQVLIASPGMKSFRIDAAGSESKTFRRIITEIEKKTKLKFDPDDGEIKIRVYPFKSTPMDGVKSRDATPKGWIVAIRAHPKPLTVRAWKKADMRGALNPCVASSIIKLLEPKKSSTLLNIMCGSGTLIAEALSLDSSLNCTAVDNNDKALACATQNLSFFKCKIKIEKADSTALPYDDKTFDLIVADLPWGEHISKNTDLKRLYIKTFQEAGRVAKPIAKLALLTQRKEIIESELRNSLSSWKLVFQTKVFQKGFTPTLYIFSR